MKLWAGRFDTPTDELMEQFQASLSFDRRLSEADVAGSIAYARALARAGLIEAAERDTLVDGLKRVRAEFASGEFEARPTDEDIHTAVERRLHELVGAVAGKLHTGRSRNDQVATDARLFVLQAVDTVAEQIHDLQAAIVDQAETHIHAIMPGYTHLRRAQPVLFSHWLMAYFWMLQRDRQRLQDCRARAAHLPLGAGALAGNAFAIDRDFLARELGFERVAQNSIDAVSDRDFIAEFLFVCALVGIHLSRLAEDLVLFSTPEFGFVEIDAAYATGSSLMPQKVNPDALELTRGKSGRLIANLTQLLVVLKGLPSTYNKDLQEDKEPLFDSVDTLMITLPVVSGVIRTLQVNAAAMEAAVDASMLATDLADYLVRRGVPFREAHGIIGRLVREASSRNAQLDQLDLGAFRTAHAAFEPDLFEVFDARRAVAARDTLGGTAPPAVRAQIGLARDVLQTVPGH